LKIVIRDDDACAFTSPEVIRSCYEKIWADVPVSLSMTPYRIPGNDRHAPENLKGCMDVFLLEENTELVSLVRSGLDSGHIDVSLHGYHPLRHNGLPEFVSGDNLAEKARKGKTCLDEMFGIDVKTFVPPNNGISSTGMQAIITAGMNLIGLPALWSSKYRDVTLKSLSLIPRLYWHRKVLRKAYPYIMDLGDHKEVAYHTVGPGSVASSLFRELDYCHQSDGVFILSTHYHAFDRSTVDGSTVGKVVYELIDKAMGYQKTKFVTINSIWETP